MCKYLKYICFRNFSIKRFDWLILRFWNRYQDNLNSLNVAQLYKQIQISNNLCKNVQQSCLGVLICGSITIEAMSLLLLIKICGPTVATRSSVMLAALGICVADCMIILIVLTSRMVQVYKESGYLQVKRKRIDRNRRIFGYKVGIERQYINLTWGLSKIIFKCLLVWFFWIILSLSCRKTYFRNILTHVSKAYVTWIHAGFCKFY